jgi:hypothetical protein
MMIDEQKSGAKRNRCAFENAPAWSVEGEQSSSGGEEEVPLDDRYEELFWHFDMLHDQDR